MATLLQRAQAAKASERERQLASRTTLEKAVDKLRALTPPEIADLMKQKGIKGRPATTSRCPIANLLQQECGGSINVGKKWIIRTSSGKKDEKVRPPDSCKEFERKFDSGAFPDLVALPDRALGVKRKRNPPDKRQKRSKKSHFPSKEVQR